MTPSQAGGSQEKLTSPRAYDLDTDSGRELHQRIHPLGGRCPMLDGGPCIWQQRVKQVEREAAAATPSLPPDSPERRLLLGLTDTLYGGSEKHDRLADRLIAIAAVLDRADDMTDAYAAERGSDHRVSRGFQTDLRAAAARLDEGSATPDHGKGEPHV